ncbi:MAG: RdgB/HAM1 family non-canonical purine NTP pyrophosphatase [bacterium]|nr:RdgB/HAM1 family non-canonical purine NTP pyrophosphatase [bacterium]
MKLLFATKNLHKLQEVEKLLDGLRLFSLNDFPDIPDVKENGKTFLENARLKAESIHKKLKVPVLADDSGLEVEALNNGPGILSKRYAGHQATDTDRIRKLLKELKDTPLAGRKARFICSMVLLTEKRTYQVCGYCHGFISFSPVGCNGFGYDPVFFLPDLDRTMAQMSMDEKNRISHRANALKKIKNILETMNEA